jgi:hypothetical protein
MCKCDTCLWDCGISEPVDECEFYCAINEEECFEDEYIEDLRKLFDIEWEEYIKDWN